MLKEFLMQITQEIKLKAIELTKASNKIYNK